MIVDCHTHIWESPEQLGRAKTDALARGRQAAPPALGLDNCADASAETHYRASEPVTKSLVFGFKSRHLGAEIPASLIGAYVRRHPDKLIGVAGIDPTNLSEALEDVQAALQEPGVKAITVSPAAQDFHPADSRAMQVFAEAARLRIPVFVQQGFQPSAASKMEFARPVLLDEVARELPQLKLVLAHMGYPWVEECVCLLGKHENLFVTIASLLQRPWQAYNALLSAYQYGVIDKVLFGSDFPFNTPTAAIESLYRINQLVTGTNLPTVPRPFLAGIVERDALGLLGLQSAAPPAKRSDTGLLDPNEP